MSADVHGSEKARPNTPSRHIFNWEWYNNYYKLELFDEDQAFKHFVEFGFSWNMDPSPFVSTSFVKRIGSDYGWSFETAASLFATLGSIVAGSNVGWSARIIPNWITAQLGIDKKVANQTLFTELLDVVGKGALLISPHPGISRVEMSFEGIALSEVLNALTQGEHVARYSIFNLAEYIASHRDLKNIGSDEEIFDHMWSIGLYENRLKYNGTTAPKWMNFDTLVFHVVTLFLLDKLPNSLADEDRSLTKLPLTSFKKYEGSEASIELLRSYNPKERSMPLGVGDLLETFDIVDAPKTSIVRSPQLIPVQSLSFNYNRNVDLLDLDLLASNPRSSVEFVVYSINLGLYDYMPIPPNLPNCSYYLITDAAKVDSNLPWRIVRPTLVERDSKRVCLWYKTHPHLLFPETLNSVWIDSNIVCLPGSEKVILAQEALSEVATFAHPDRNCVYKEAQAIVDMGLDSREVISAVIEKMRSQGMPADNGLYETNVLYSKSRDYAVRKFMNQWWNNVFFGSRRDQMSFTFAAHQVGIEISPLDGRNSTKTSRYFTKRAHRYAGGRQLVSL